MERAGGARNDGGHPDEALDRRHEQPGANSTMATTPVEPVATAVKASS